MEEWKWVVGYEGYYRISSLGKIKNAITGNILKPSKAKTGYLHITLCYKGKKDVLIHRLVALAFIPNPNKYKYVNHKDEVKSNNKIENLEWCTAKYNVNYGEGSKARNTKIIQLDLNGDEIKRWESIKQASESLDIKYQLISRCLSKKRKTTHGYKWDYVA